MKFNQAHADTPPPTRNFPYTAINTRDLRVLHRRVQHMVSIRRHPHAVPTHVFERQYMSTSLTYKFFPVTIS